MKAMLTIANDTWRRRAIAAVERAPFGSRVEIRDPVRSVEQNSKMWALLEEVARQKTHAGRYYTAEQWKVLFLHALGEEVQFLPALSGNSFVPYGFQSSKLSRAQMSELLEFIVSWGTQHGIVFDDELRKAGTREVAHEPVSKTSNHETQSTTKETV